VIFFTVISRYLKFDQLVSRNRLDKVISVNFEYLLALSTLRNQVRKAE
jgi:hypothetical protein